MAAGSGSYGFRACGRVTGRQSPPSRVAPSVVYRHADVPRVLRDNETFSSAVIGEGMGRWGRKIIVGWTSEHHRHRARLSGVPAHGPRSMGQSLVQRVVDELIDGCRPRSSEPGQRIHVPVSQGDRWCVGLPEEDYRQFQLGGRHHQRGARLAPRCQVLPRVAGLSVRILDERRQDPATTW